jgi:hypothetical protein
MRYWLFLLCGCIIFFGCEKELDIKVPFKGQKLVINSFNNPDSVWSLNLSLTRHVLDTNDFFQTPRNAVVTIHNPVTNEILDVLNTNEPFGNSYRGNLKPEPEKEYLIRVVSQDYGTAEATGFIPPSVPIDKIEIDSSMLHVDYKVKVSVFFHDPPSKKNFYRLNISGRAYGLDFHWENGSYITDTIWQDFYNPILFEPTDNKILESDINNILELMFSDTFFEGSTHALIIYISEYDFLNFRNARYPIRIVLASLTEPYFQYVSTLNLQQETSGDPFAQPVQVYSNFQNGFGIFAGYNQSVKELKY